MAIDGRPADYWEVGFARRARGGRADVRWVDGAFHEILNEPDAPAHVAEIGRWISALAARAPD